MYCKPLGVVKTPLTDLFLARKASPSLRFAPAAAVAAACWAACRRAEKTVRSALASASESTGLPFGSDAARKPCRKRGMSNSPLIFASERPMSPPTNRPTLVRSGAAAGLPPPLRALMLAINDSEVARASAASSNGLPAASAFSTPRWNAAMSMSGTAGATERATSIPIM